MKQKRSRNKKSKLKTAKARSQRPTQKHAADSDLSPEVKEQLRIAREFMEKYRKTFAILAKT